MLTSLVRNVAVSCQSEVVSAQIVRSRSPVPVIWLGTGELIQTRDRMSVMFAVAALKHAINLPFTAEFIVDANRTHVTCVTRRLHSLLIKRHNNNNNDRLTAFDPGQPG